MHTRYLVVSSINDIVARPQFHEGLDTFSCGVESSHCFYEMLASVTLHFEDAKGQAHLDFPARLFTPLSFTACDSRSTLFLIEADESPPIKKSPAPDQAPGISSKPFLNWAVACCR